MHFEVPTEVVCQPPVVVAISVTDICNLRCVQCPHVDHKNDHWVHCTVAPVKFSEATAQAKTVSLHGGGEVLVHPRWHEYVPKTPGCDTGFVTNGTLLDARNVQKVVDSGLGWLNISFDAGSPEAYRKIRGSDWTRLWAGIDRLVASQAKLNLTANMTLMRANLHEPAKLVPLLAGRGFKLLHLFHLNQLSGPDLDQWNYSFHDGSGTFSYRDQQFTPQDTEVHDVAMRHLAGVAQAHQFKVVVTGLFLGKLANMEDLNELTSKVQ